MDVCGVIWIYDVGTDEMVTLGVLDRWQALHAPWVELEGMAYRWGSVFCSGFCEPPQPAGFQRWP